RVVQPLDKDLGKGTKGRRLEPSPGAKAARLGGRAMAAVSCPAPISSEAQALRPCQGSPRGSPPEIIDSSNLPTRGLEAGRTFRGLCRFGRGPRAAQARPKRGRAAQDKSMKRTGPRKSTISDWRSPATKPTRYSRPSTAGLMEIARLAGRPARRRTARIWPRA